MKQGYNSRLDESLGSRNGKKSQSYKSRRNESKGMMKHFGEHPYSADHNMKQILWQRIRILYRKFFREQSVGVLLAIALEKNMAVRAAHQALRNITLLKQCEKLINLNNIYDKDH